MSSHMSASDFVLGTVLFVAITGMATFSGAWLGARMGGAPPRVNLVTIVGLYMATGVAAALRFAQGEVAWQVVAMLLVGIASAALGGRLGSRRPAMPSSESR